MFGPKEPTQLDKAVDKAVRSLNNWEVTSKEYGDALRVVERLHDLREREKPDRVKLDTLVVVGANLLGVLLIIQAERVHIISRAALSLLPRAKQIT